VFDTITDFQAASDIIDHGAAITIVTYTPAASGTADINAEGICTFHADDDTLTERITAAEGGIQTGVAAAGQTAIFESGSDSYVFISDGADGVGANDILIQLTGVTGLNDMTIAAGNMTID